MQRRDLADLVEVQSIDLPPYDSVKLGPEGRLVRHARYIEALNVLNDLRRVAG